VLHKRAVRTCERGVHLYDRVYVCMHATGVRTCVREFVMHVRAVFMEVRGTRMYERGCVCMREGVYFVRVRYHHS